MNPPADLLLPFKHFPIDVIFNVSSASVIEGHSLIKFPFKSYCPIFLE